MASFNKFQQFVEDLAKGVHNFTSDSTCTVTVALTTNANAPAEVNTLMFRPSKPLHRRPNPRF